MKACAQGRAPIKSGSCSECPAGWRYPIETLGRQLSVSPHSVFPTLNNKAEAVGNCLVHVE